MLTTRLRNAVFLALLVPTLAVAGASEPTAEVATKGAAAVTADSFSPLLFEDGFEYGDTRLWGTPPLIDMSTALTRNLISLPNNARNAIERSHIVHYLGTGKSIDSQPKRQVPFRAYFASCAEDTERPRMFVSLTLADTSAGANPNYPEVGSVFETEFNPVTGILEPTGNQTVLDLCNETHGIVASDDCSRVAVLCATAIEEPVSETYTGSFQDLVPSGGDTTQTTQSNNEDIINGIPGLTPQERLDRYQYNGEMWLLEWDNNAALSTEPAKYVIHKAYGGGNPWSAPSLAMSETDDSYGAAFATNVFDTNHGGRHWSAALMVVERDPWRLNHNDRGWGWLCAYGHVFNVSTFWNPFIDDERAGEYGALCTSDGNTYTAFLGGTIGIKYESSNLFEGYSQYLVPSNNSAVTNGGGHRLIPIDANRSIGVMTGPEMQPFDDPDYLAFIEMTEQSALNFYGAAEVEARNLYGLAACNWYDDSHCLFGYARWEYSGTYPLYPWGFWWKNHDAFNGKDLSKIGIFHTQNGSSGGRNIAQKNGHTVKWVAEDDDCMLGAPQLVDLQNGRYLLGYGKYQCISDGFHLRRFATSANGTRSVSTVIPSEYYVMEIDADGNALTQPTALGRSGWGGLDALVSLGPGRAAWAYVPFPKLLPDGTFPDPSQATWELLVYESPLGE